MTGNKLLFAGALGASFLFGQNAQLSGLIQDPSALKIPGAEITLRNEQTGGKRVTKSNDDGLYSIFSLNPGVYRISVHAANFETVIREGIKLDVGESARLDFDLRIGDSHTEVTVHSDAPQINTEDASVGTVIAREIIDQMPLNGRGIQSLIELTPGVVVTPVVDATRGQFAVNGQRTDANYFTVDGVSANFSAGDATQVTNESGRNFSIGQAGGGMLPANNFLGTFSNLVSPDALQEFKIQTSTFAPEYGRSPGAQIGLISRSGGNRYTGSLFEYFRNDKADANDWFSNQLAMPKPPRTAVLPSPNGSQAKPNLGPGVTRCTFVRPCGTPGVPAMSSPSKGLPTPGTSAPINTAGYCAPVTGLTATRCPAAFRPGL